MNTDLANVVYDVARMMELAARTAPKTRGDDFIMVKILRGEILKRLADSMVDFGQQKGKGNFDRDGANVAASQALVLIGLKDAATAGLNCGACGYSTCREKAVAVYQGLAEAHIGRLIAVNTVLIVLVQMPLTDRTGISIWA